MNDINKNGGTLDYKNTEKSDDYNRMINAINCFYRFKSLLLPSFLERNKRSLNSIEAELMREYQKGGDEK